MKNYKLTLPRTILFAVLFAGGIYYFAKNGIDEMATYEIVLSAVLMIGLLALLLLKLLGLAKNNS